MVCKFQFTSIEFRFGTESEFMGRFMAHEMAIYDSTKEEQMEKLKIKIVAGYNSYGRMKLQHYLLCD